MKKRKVIVDFEAVVEDGLLDKNIRDGVSSIACTGRYLWVAGDENVSIQRLEKLEDGSYGKGRNFFLKDFFDLPSLEEEADIEGMDVSGNYLWIVGSHSYKRKKAREDGENPEEEIDRLSMTELGSNRNLLARIPLVQDENGEFVLRKECVDPENPDGKLTAAKLKHSKRKWSQLTKKLRRDKHLGTFVGLPGKDNGFDIEGIAVLKDKIFLGLRGPVLRGWAVILEIAVEEKNPGLLTLRKDSKTSEYFKKRFVNLNGMGIRELVCQKKDLIILAGPTMDLDGVMEIYRWKNGLEHEEGKMVKRQDIDSIMVFPQKGKVHGRDKAEGLAIRKGRHLLVAYDSPGDERRIGDHKVVFDEISLPAIPYGNNSKNPEAPK